MRIIFKFIFVLALSPALLGCGAEKFRDPVYEPSDTQMEFADICSKALIRNNVKFASGARNLEGCACMADKLEAHGANPDDTQFYALAGGAVRVLARAEKKEFSDTSYEAAMAELRNSHQATAKDIEQLMSRMGKAFAYCGRKDSRQLDREKKMCETMSLAQRQEKANDLKKHGLKFDTKTCAVSQIEK